MEIAFLSEVPMDTQTGVNAVTIVFAALCVFAIAYRFYGLFIAQKVLNVNEARQTPKKFSMSMKPVKPLLFATLTVKTTSPPTSMSFSVTILQLLLQRVRCLDRCLLHNSATCPVSCGS